MNGILGIALVLTYVKLRMGYTHTHIHIYFLSLRDVVGTKPIDDWLAFIDWKLIGPNWTELRHLKK